MREDARRLAEQGRWDLRHAEGAIGIGAHEVAAFLSHQAAEKALEVLWIVRRREVPPMTHTLPELGRALGVPEALVDDLLDLNPDCTVARYPDAANGIPHEVYSEPIARRKVEAARRVFAWAEAQWTD